MGGLYESPCTYAKGATRWPECGTNPDRHQGRQRLTQRRGSRLLPPSRLDSSSFSLGCIPGFGQRDHTRQPRAPSLEELTAHNSASRPVLVQRCSVRALYTTILLPSNEAVSERQGWHGYQSRWSLVSALAELCDCRCVLMQNWILVNTPLTSFSFYQTCVTWESHRLRLG